MPKQMNELVTKYREKWRGRGAPTFASLMWKLKTLSGSTSSNALWCEPRGYSYTTSPCTFIHLVCACVNGCRARPDTTAIYHFFHECRYHDEQKARRGTRVFCFDNALSFLITRPLIMSAPFHREITRTCSSFINANNLSITLFYFSMSKLFIAPIFYTKLPRKMFLHILFWIVNCFYFHENDK